MTPALSSVLKRLLAVAAIVSAITALSVPVALFILRQLQLPRELRAAFAWLLMMGCWLIVYLLFNFVFRRITRSSVTLWQWLGRSSEVLSGYLKSKR